MAATVEPKDVAGNQKAQRPILQNWQPTHVKQSFACDTQSAI